MNIPIRLAHKTATETNQHVAIAFRGSVLINYANNVKGKIHAEMRVLVPLLVTDTNGKFFSNITVISLRINRRGNLAMAKPCKVCEHKLKVYGVRRVYYSNREGKIERLA